MQTAAMLPPTSPPALVRLALAAVLVMAAAFAGQWATGTAIADWYPALVKPAFTPPPIVFPIVWPILYALMAFAFWRILRRPAGTPGRRGAITLFVAQIAFNAAWSFAFFGMRSPAAGVAVIVVLDLLVALTLVRFYRLDRPAGLALVPYLAWIAFATLLNVTILTLN